MTRLRALLARNDGTYAVQLEELDASGLPPRDVLVEVSHSSLNYKDALAITGKGRIVRKFPMVLGIDLAGTVVESSSPLYKAGDRVLAVGQGLGESEWGGYATLQRVHADALVPLPEGLSLEAAMQLGTAGFTAMLCVMALERARVQPGERELVVTGATGGVGSIAVMLLAKRGHRVAASTGRAEHEAFLRDLGATSIVPRDELARPSKPMESERWAGGVDTVGGQTLATLFAGTAYGGAIACCGMAGGHELATTVWPLILRNVSLLGVSSILTPRDERIEAWSQLARDVDRDKLASLSTTVPLSRLTDAANDLFAGRVRGRIVVDTRG